MNDIVVVGGGPAGSKVAATLAKDRDVLVIEEHGVSGRPAQCAGLITESTAEMAGVKPIILNRFCGADVIFPDGGVVSVFSDKTKAIVIDRADFDEKMAYAAQDAGAEYRYNTRYLGHTADGRKATVETDSGRLESRVLVGADGYRSEVASVIPNNGPSEYLRGMQYDIRYRMECQDRVRIRIGSIAPGLFSWEVPMGDLTRVGLCISWDAGPPIGYMKRLLIKAGLEDKEIVSKYCGKIPVGRRKITHADNLLLIGDAAGQVKPVSAGGISPAMSCAPYLCQTVEESFRRDDFSSDTLSMYDDLWINDVGKELDRAYKMRKMYVKLTDTDMNKIRTRIGSERINAMLNDVDIDHPNAVAAKVLKSLPMVLRMAPIILKNSVKR